MPHEDLTRLRHMLDSAQEASGLIKGKGRADLDRDRLLNLALVRLLEIVGEAASRVTIPTRLKYPDIPWTQIVSLRNRLIHGYDAVDFPSGFQAPAWKPKRSVSYTHLRAHETRHDLVCRLLLENKKKK